jgi:hypothetical protein
VAFDAEARSPYAAGALPWELTRPIGLYLLGLLGPLIGLYILRVRRTRQVVSSTWLWRTAARDLAASKPFQRLTPSVPLLLECLAVVVLALALSGPRSRGARELGSRLVLVVDVSASMGAVEDGVAGGTAGGTRLDAARKTAHELLSRLEPGAETMIVAAAREAELASPFERDRTRLRAALDRLFVHDVEGRLAPALALGAEQLRQRGGGRMVLITDGAVADADALVAPGSSVELMMVGRAKENTALLRAHVVRGKDAVTGRDRVEAFAVVWHQGSRPRDVFVTLSQKNVREPLATRRLSVPPDQHTPVVLGFDAAPNDAGTGLVLELSPPDTLASDDRAQLRVPAGRRLPVVLAPKEASPWLRRVFESDGAVELFSASLAGLSPETVPDDALVVIDGACPPKIPGADLLIVNPPPGPCRTLEVQAAPVHTPVTSWTEADPRLRFLSFDGVQVSNARQLRVDGARDALVRTRDGVLIADASSPGRNGTIVGFDVGASNWPLTASFVLFMRNLTEAARAGRANGPSWLAKAGEPISLRIPLGTERVTVLDPRGKSREVPARDGLAVLPAPDSVGFYLASWGGPRPGSSLLAVNLESETESRIAPKPLSLQGGKGKPLAAPEGVTHYEWLLALVGLLLLTADVVWITRPLRAGSGRERPRLPERPLGTRAPS